MTMKITNPLSRRQPVASKIRSFTTGILVGLTALTLVPSVALAESGPGPGPFGPGPGCNSFPASAATGSSVGISYFGPPPSESNPSLVGPVQLLKSGTVDFNNGTITLPLYKGKLAGSGKTVWYILTDTSDAGNATSLGLNPSAKLAFAATASRVGRFDSNGVIVFDAGKVDFSPERSVTPGPADQPYPPAAAQPGSVGDQFYSPLVRLVNAGNAVYNAPMIAFDVTDEQINFPNGSPDYRLVHDEVVAIDTQARTVTLQLVNGFSFGRPLLYLSMDSNDPTISALEANTYAPFLKRVVVGQDDSFSSSVERIFIALNGATEGGCANPQRQGLNAALTDGFRPNNTFGGIPTLATDYSPLWDANIYQWTTEAINSNYRGQLREEFQILTYVEDGLLTGINGNPFGSTGIVINCPPVFRLV